MVSEVGGSKPIGTNSSAVMAGTVWDRPGLVHADSARRHAGPTPALCRERAPVGRVLLAMESGYDAEADFAFGLDVVLDGLGHVLSTETKR